MKTVIKDTYGSTRWDVRVEGVGNLLRLTTQSGDHIPLRRAEAEQLLAFIDLWLSENEDAE